MLCTRLAGAPVERVLLATDGSTPARAAVDIVANWPFFASAQIRVLGIASPPSRYAGQVLSPADLRTLQNESANDTKAAMDGVVGEAIDQLTAARRDVQGRVRTGDPHSQIVAAAREWRTDLIVIGATGQSPLRSILLGSVARRILHRVRPRSWSHDLMRKQPLARTSERLKDSGPSDGD